jgi:hypothetical protein
LVDYASYVHFLVLLRQWQEAPGESTAQYDRADALIQYLWQIHDNAMVQTYRITELLAYSWNRGSNQQRLRDRWGSATAPGWSSIPASLSASQIQALLAADVASYPVLFTPVHFSDSLVPLQSSASAPPTVWTTLPKLQGSMPFVFHPRQAGAVAAQVMWHGASNQPKTPVHYKIWNPEGVLLSSATIPADGSNPVYPNLDQWYEIAFNAPAAGPYRMEIYDQKHGYYLATPNNVPFGSVEGIQPESQANVPIYPYADWGPGHYVGLPKAYFYVPPGTTRFALYQDRRVALAFNVRTSSGSLVPCVNDLTCKSDFLVFDVPPGTDGSVWSVDNLKGTNGALTLLNVPNILSPTPEQLLKPSGI